MSRKPVPRPSLWTAAKRQARLIFELMPDIALLPFGLLDDLVVIIVCLTIFVAIVPKEVMEEHRGWLDAADITIDDLQETRRLPPNGEEKD